SSIIPSDADAPAGRRDIGTEQTQERSFARSVRPQEADHFSSLNRTRDVVEYGRTVEGLARVVNFNDRHRQLSGALIVFSCQFPVVSFNEVVSCQLSV